MKQTSREDLIKHWLLNTAIEFPRSLLHILPGIRGLTLNAKEVPGCDPEGYAQGLGELFRSGHIVFTSANPEDDVHSALGVDSVLNRFLGYPMEVTAEQHVTKKPQPVRPHLKIPKVQFSLTESGGALWESIAKPEWNRFYDQSTDYEAGDAVSPDMTLLMANLGWLPELRNGVTIEVESLRIEEHFDYPVLYWKKLPRVYRATFKCHRAEARWKRVEWATFPIEPEWFRYWWHSTVYFYKLPWELSGWPSA